MKHAHTAFLFVFLFVLTACNAITPGASSNPYVGDWTWELTAHDIDGGGSVGRGTVSVQDFSENGLYGEGEGAWGSCEGWCSLDSKGGASAYIDGQFLTVVLKGSTPAEQSLTKGWLTAGSLSPVGKDAYEGIAEFGVCSTGVKCHSSTLIRVSKISDTPTYSIP